MDACDLYTHIRQGFVSGTGEYNCEVNLDNMGK